MFIKWGIVLLGIGVLNACAVVPTGPNVMVLPTPGKPFEVFQGDDVVCRQYAQSQIGLEPAEAANQSAVTSGAVGTVLGAAAGALIGAGVGNPAAGAAIGAGSGLVLGGATGVRQVAPPQRLCSPGMTWRMSSVCTPKGIRCPAWP